MDERDSLSVRATVARQQIVAEARSHLGEPFRHQGRSREGLDCVGLVILVASALGLSEFDTRDYQRIPDGKLLLALCRREMTEIDPAAARPGDVLVVRIKRFPQHMAIVADYAFGGLSIVHSYAILGRVVESRLDETWRRLIVGAFRLPGVA